MSAPGGEGAVAGPGDHDRPAVGVAIERLERVGEGRDQREVEGVEDLVAVDDDEGDAVDRAVGARRRQGDVQVS